MCGKKIQTSMALGVLVDQGKNLLDLTYMKVTQVIEGEIVIEKVEKKG